MGRLLAFVLGGAALALYGPHLFLGKEQIENYKSWWVKALGGGDTGQGWYESIFAYGPGIFAGLALLLLALRGKD